MITNTCGNRPVSLHLEIQLTEIRANYEVFLTYYSYNSPSLFV